MECFCNLKREIPHLQEFGKFVVSDYTTTCHACGHQDIFKMVLVQYVGDLDDGIMRAHTVIPINPLFCSSCGVPFKRLYMSCGTQNVMFVVDKLRIDAKLDRCIKIFSES